MVTIALDAMGGDNAPLSVIEGAARLVREQPRSAAAPLAFLFYGDAARIHALLAAHPALKNISSVIHTDLAIAADEKPSVALRRGAGSSMRLAIDAVKEGKADCIVSAGNTGALMAMAKLALRTLPGISRPAIAALFPTMRGSCVMLDLGANIASDARELVQFAIMGDAFARIMLALPSPLIGLLNVGAEEMKGVEEVREASILLREHTVGLNFHGFVEGNDIAGGAVDVVVTDGFTGNVALKTAEGIGQMVGHYVRDTFTSSLRSRLGYLLARPSVRKLRAALDPRRRNGAMFLGLNGIVVKSHGGADGYSFYFAVKTAMELASNRINTRIVEELQHSLPQIAAPHITVPLRAEIK